MAKFTVNNKIHLAIKVLPFMANYSRELRMGVDIRKKRKSGESNGVCEKYKETSERSRSSIKNKRK